MGKNKKHTNPNCQCASCKGKRGEYKGSNSPVFGNHLAEETIKKMSLAHIGKHHTKETIQKMIKNHKGMSGKHPTEKTCRKMGEKTKERWQNSEYKVIKIRTWATLQFSK